MIYNGILLYPDWCLARLSSERLHSAIGGNRYRDPQPNTRWSRGAAEEGDEGFKNVRRDNDTTRNQIESTNQGS